jgi:N-glycosylase/DNA lyase
VAHPLPADVDLDACLFGGQAFTWWRANERVHGIARGTRLVIAPEARTWQATPERELGFLERYLGADRVRPDDLADDADLGELARAMPGLRLLDQDPWEAFLAFLITPVNNVPRVQETIARLCRTLGPEVEGARAVPGPAAVAEAGEDRLRELGLGFRAPRVAAAAREVDEGRLDLDRVAGLDVEDASQRLQDVDGVGPKVAECILCYALSFDDAFPVDRWVARASEQLLGEEVSPARARRRWGETAAMAQQVLFHGARKGLVEGLDPSPVATFDGWRSLVGTPDAGPKA